MRKKIVFLTGAGVSRESGIKTFRDEDGLWEGYSVDEVASIQGWRKDKEKVLKFYNERRSQLDTVEPNEAHKLIVELEKNHEVVVITQNVDDLHERGGSSNVIHLHGELRKMCSSINKSKTLPFDKDIKIGDKHEDGSQLRPYIVWFGEDVPKMFEAVKHVMDADILVVVGTSLEVYPAAGLTEYVKKSCLLYYIDPKPSNNTPSIENFITIKKVATEGMVELINMLK
jgi:NAD-dependent deacetylase